MADEFTADEIAEKYKGMLDCVTMIESLAVKKLWEDSDPLVANANGAGWTDEFRKKIVSNNVDHLEMMLKQSYWTSEDMTSVNKAVTDGKAFIA
tara:strand:- start:751 stop:1032 length:282 start_codon:yes stop_codon:yes gene_type:complete